MLPDWMPKEAWMEFVAMRKRIKKPLTEYATKLAIKKLTKMYEEKQNIEEVLNQSIFNQWQDLYPITKAVNSNQIDPQRALAERTYAETAQKIQSLSGPKIMNKPEGLVLKKLVKMH